MLLAALMGEGNLAGPFGKPLSLGLCDGVMTMRTADAGQILFRVHILSAQRHLAGMTELVRALFQIMVN